MGKSHCNSTICCSSHTIRLNPTVKTSLEHVFILILVFQASYFPDPIPVYTHIYSKGIGTRTAALYVAWAQQCEQSGLNEHANAVYQNAMANQAQPADTVLNEYR